MRVLPATANVVSFTPRRRLYATENDRELSRQWVGHLRSGIKAGDLSTVLAVAKSLASPRYPSFWRGGIYARQSAIGVDSDVGLSGRQIARVIDLLVDMGYLDRAQKDLRKGRTCLIQPKTPIDKMSAAQDILSDTPDMVSEESSNLKPTNPTADSPLPPAEPGREALSGLARCSLSTTRPLSDQRAVQEAPKGEIIQLDAFCDDRWRPFRNDPGIAGKDRDRGGDENSQDWRAHLRRRLGNDVFRAWFGQVRTVGLDESGVVTMAVKSRFKKSRIDNEYAEQLLAAWRAHDATVVSIKLVVGI
jgi:hypothetical protein